LTFKISNSLSLTFELGSILYSLVKTCFENVKYVRKIGLEDSFSYTNYMTSWSNLIRKHMLFGINM